MRPAPQTAADAAARALAPPGEILALVVTDIEGSSELWERAPEAMAAALTRHNALAREVLARHDGYEVKSEGDAFVLAFADAGAGLRWCLELEAALRAEPWPAHLRDARGRVGLRLRMGLHLGAPLRRIDPVTGREDLLGPELHRASRVASAGNGGQILLSEPALRAVEELLPTLGRVGEDLGLYTLRGVSSPERLHALYPAGPTRPPSPPLRAARWRPEGPLADPDRFIGRAGDLASVRRHFGAGSRLLTLVGPGGTGKTRLSRRYGAEQAGDWPGGILFCELAEAHDADAARAAVARGLDLATGASDQAIGTAMAARGRALFILDNLEQISETLAGPVAAWLSAPGQHALLLTSRRALGLPEEVVLALGPLSLPPPDAQRPDELLASEAAQLYLERADEQGAGLTLEPQLVADVARLVRRLDGLPLAIELAAAWTRLLSPAATLARIEARAGPWSRARGARPGRQATLRAVVDWSWTLLSPTDQAVFAQTSIFEGGFSLELAEAVLDPGERTPVVRALDRLVSHSLLRRAEADGRYSLLVTLQDFAAEKLAERPTEQEATERRHMAALAGLISRSPPDRRTANQDPALRAERENLLAAARRALGRRDLALIPALSRAAVELLLGTGPVGEAVEIARAAAALPGLPPLEEARASLRLGEALRQAGVGEEARAQLRDAIARAEACGESALISDARMTAGMQEHDRREFAAAREHYLAGLALAERIADGSRQTRLRTALSHLARESGRMDEAMEHIQRGMAACPAEDRWGHRRALVALALWQLDLGRAAEAALTLRELLDLARADGDRVMELTALGNLAGALLDLRELQEALAIMRQSLRLARALGNLRLTAINTGNLGDVLLELGRLDEAEPLLREAVAVSSAVRLSDAVGAFRGSLGEVLARRGLHRAAVEELEEGARTLASVSNLIELLRLRRRQIRLAGELGLDREPLLAEARELCRKLGLQPGSAAAPELAPPVAG